MIIDYLAQFCDADTITATVANAIVGDVMDLGNGMTLRDIGNGENIFLYIHIPTAATSNGSATVTFTLLSDSTANLATSATTHITTPAYTMAQLAAGATFAFRLPPGSYERYLGIFANTAVQTLNTGTVSAGLVLDVPKQQYLPDAL